MLLITRAVIYMYTEKLGRKWAGSLLQNGGTICLNWEKGFSHGKSMEIVANGALKPSLNSPKSQVCPMMSGVAVLMRPKFQQWQ